MTNKKYILLSAKSWHHEVFDNLIDRKGEDWYRISKKEDFSISKLKEISPDRIFIPHWSYIIPAEIFQTFECIVFHMTDLPYGRGGSPLQNLIVRGHKETKISAIRVNEGIDTGKLYLKAPLSLLGTAQEIFLRSAEIIESMIKTIIENDPQPEEQRGEPVNFKRRKPEDGDISDLNDLDKVYDYIRMLDCEGYPPAFLETDKFRLHFSRATLKADKSIIADVRITKK
ncbi:formyltransferase family protein [Phaeodactylibacter xiamenensis]|uniref:formyltransferase family protein n=1 Tax=Phaeodactylibacter xiamenensis TaxID=1524460 RepID=UPI0024A7C786|nr:formyltransferase family protein [Phaeodactylibacter xiamenensis]